MTDHPAPDPRAARRFAAHAHEGQRYGDGPYTTHLDDVATVLADHHCDAAVVTAGYLHDTLEDTRTTPEELAAAFGPRVRRTVELVTDKPGRNRRERHEATYPAIAMAAASGEHDATEVKVADRIANLRRSLAGDAGRLRMYLKEHDRFRELLRRPGVADGLWATLDALVAEARARGTDRH
jgi:(p)ppGpp synthase/HD superfamily hydrolase